MQAPWYRDVQLEAGEPTRPYCHFDRREKSERTIGSVSNQSRCGTRSDIEAIVT